MKFTINRESLLAPLTKVAPLASRKTLLPILGQLLVRATDNQLSLTGSNREIEISTSIEAHIAEPGIATVPAKRLLDIARAMPNGAEMTIVVTDDKASIKAGRSRFNLVTLPADTYPLFTSMDEPRAVGIGREQLRLMLEHAAYAKAVNDVRYYLNGIYLSVADNLATHVATDGHRLAMATSTLEEPGEPFGVIIPGETVGEMQRLLKDDGVFRLEIASNAIRLTNGASTLTSKLIDGKYPDYKRVIPSLPVHTVIINRDDFRQALTRTQILANEQFGGVALAFEPGSLTLTSSNATNDQAEEVVEIDGDISGISVGFRASYLLEAIGTIDTEQVEIQLTDSTTSALIRGHGRAEQTHVVMPMLLGPQILH